MNILITGANGQLGNEMKVLSAENTQHTYFFTDVQELDICNEEAIEAFVAENEIELIVNCAAYTAVDNAEDNRELCDKLNHIAPPVLPNAGVRLSYRCLQITFLTERPIFLIQKKNQLVRPLYMALPNWQVNRR